ncbi:hypothetical protein CONPUDRAFT_89091 [Coniophora puteana RWD-64-598 SS2]|uniref:Multiple myeloma tumor-associated protein 2-like N-terminal domain-containing protein n=1 Tax=Coniophora puteana (strain RWD-64-598) TaxID=741705 RepID=A0A5M3MVE7_CONPW|nr:uncharacterized protein CONPUDRAFT_89091 [Coniophora puteana RWD-64-598 SS2]EIW83103.1 hypothetical protein CONPUDRAFT_89091 [Coniophora puteana RWD-64-598 SS2]
MFEPVRGGTRGGQAEFKWSDVTVDKDRENYLGHSINAPAGRWQKNKDIHWYNRDLDDGEAARKEEIRKVKEAEAEALSAALGFEATPKGAQEASSSTTRQPENAEPDDSERLQRAQEKEEKRRKKAERKEEKRARKEARRERRNDEGALRHRSSRSRSPRPRSHYQDGDRRSRHSRSPHVPSERRRDVRDYDAVERERERENDHRRWNFHSRRDLPDARDRRD